MIAARSRPVGAKSWTTSDGAWLTAGSFLLARRWENGQTAERSLARAAAGCTPEHTGSPDDPHDRNAKVPSIEASYEMVGLGKPPLSFVTYSGGYIKIVDETTFTVATGISAAEITVEPGAMRCVARPI